MRNGRLQLSPWARPLFRVQCQPKKDWSKKCALFGLLLGFTCVSWYVNNLLSLLEHQNPLPQVPFLPIIQREKMLHTQRGTNNNCYCYWNGHKKPEILFASVMHWTLSILSYICIVLYWLEFLLRSELSLVDMTLYLSLTLAKYVIYFQE